MAGIFSEVVYCCAENTGRYLLIALLLSTVTMLSQTAFQLYGIFAESVDDSVLAQCEWVVERLQNNYCVIGKEFVCFQHCCVIVEFNINPYVL